MLTLLLLSAALPSLTGDFDHDGRLDLASVVGARGRYALVVRRGGARQAQVIEQLDNLRYFYLDKAKRGSFTTFCGQSLVGRCNPRVVRLRGGELTFGYEEASEKVVIWNGSRFKTVLMSD